MDIDQKNMVAYTIDNSPNGEIAERIMGVYNGNSDVAVIAVLGICGGALVLKRKKKNKKIM